MALTDGNLSVSDIAAVMKDNNNTFGGDGAWWLIVLFLFLFAGGNGNWGGNNSTNSDLQRGFDQSQVLNSLGAINSSVNNGFADAAVSRCNDQTTLLQAINNASTAQQLGFCSNNSAVADLKYTVATENCSDRAMFQQGIQSIIANQTAATQSILEKMSKSELEAERRENDNLRAQLNMANLVATQTEQTSRILSDNAAQTVALENYLNPPPIPAYVVQNPNYSVTGCCGSF